MFYRRYSIFYREFVKIVNRFIYVHILKKQFISYSKHFGLINGQNVIKNRKKKTIMNAFLSNFLDIHVLLNSIFEI